MIKKKVDLTIHQGRSVTTFFRRNLENFERKFDGFPAILLSPAETPAVQEESPDYGEYIDEIVDAISNTAPTGFVPPCADIPAGDCIDNLECVEDTFQGTTTIGTGWGVSDSGHNWNMTSAGNNSMYVPVNGRGQILAVTAGTGTSSTATRSEILPSCAPDGSHVDILARFTCNDASAWSSTHVYSQASGIAEAVNAPGVRTDTTTPNDNLQAGVGRHFIQINTSGVAFGSYVRIYNADSQLWFTTKYSNSIYQNPPTVVGPASDNFWLRMQVTSDGVLSAKVWDNSDPEPDGWWVQEPNRDYNGEPAISGTFQTNSVAWSTYSVRVHEFYLNTIVGNEDCSGNAVVGDLTSNGSGGYTANVPVKSYIEVFFDDLMAVKHIDYTEEDGVITPTYTLDPNMVVRSRYLVS